MPSIVNLLSHTIYIQLRSCNETFQAEGTRGFQSTGPFPKPNMKEQCQIYEYSMVWQFDSIDSYCCFISHRIWGFGLCLRGFHDGYNSTCERPRHRHICYIGILIIHKVEMYQITPGANEVWKNKSFGCIHLFGRERIAYHNYHLDSNTWGMLLGLEICSIFPACCMSWIELTKVARIISLLRLQIEGSKRFHPSFGLCLCLEIMGTQLAGPRPVTEKIRELVYFGHGSKRQKGRCKSFVRWAHWGCHRSWQDRCVFVENKDGFIGQWEQVQRCARDGTRTTTLVRLVTVPCMQHHTRNGTAEFEFSFGPSSAHQLRYYSFGKPVQLSFLRAYSHLDVLLKYLSCK